MGHLTGGKLNERFANVSTTGRDRIASEDLEVWSKHVVFGAGLGLSKIERAMAGGHRASAHTEYTRLLADHGLLGGVALLLLLASVGLNMLRRQPGLAKPVIIAGTVWALLYLAVSGMRTAVPAFLIGLGFARASFLPIFTPRKRRLAGPMVGGPMVGGPVAKEGLGRKPES
jgi:hypothetical protein